MMMYLLNPNLKNINGYLVEAENIFFDRTKKQLSNEYLMDFGSMPNDGGYLLLKKDEYESLINSEPTAKKYLRPFIGAQEFLNSVERWCIWLDTDDLISLNQDLAKMPSVKERIENVKKHRASSTREATKKLASTPHLFGEIRQPKSGNYLLVPSVSSENRRFIPIGFLSHETVCSNLVFSVSNATPYHFGILSSSMHNAFMRLTAGRLESRYRYSNTIVYNNFLYPFMADDDSDKAQKARESIAKAAQEVLDARKHYQDGSDDAPTLAQLYNTYLIDPYPLLTKAHKALDKAVDSAYGYRGKGDDASRVEFLIKKIAELNT